MSYYDYQAQRWVEQAEGEREIVRVGSDGTIYYADNDQQGT